VVVVEAFGAFNLKHSDLTLFIFVYHHHPQVTEPRLNAGVGFSVVVVLSDVSVELIVLLTLATSTWLI